MKTTQRKKKSSIDGNVDVRENNGKRLISPFGSCSKEFIWKLASFAEYVSESMKHYGERHRPVNF